MALGSGEHARAAQQQHNSRLSREVGSEVCREDLVLCSGWGKCWSSYQCYPLFEEWRVLPRVFREFSGSSYICPPIDVCDIDASKCIFVCFFWISSGFINLDHLCHQSTELFRCTVDRDVYDLEDLGLCLRHFVEETLANLFIWLRCADYGMPVQLLTS